ncbi:MAG: type 4a pilus biogenesis protein PilO [Candidatus Pacebacteria bacterium]|nr:type 4a pilus biogenesis protein PilO [Candidatus Paceibacterota bacterium]
MGRFIFSLFAILISIAIFVIVVIPRYHAIQELRSERAELVSAVSSGADLRVRRDELTRQYNAISQDSLSKLKSLLPDSIDNVKLILELDALARTYGLPIQNVRVREVEDDTGAQQSTVVTDSRYGTTRLELTLEGRYDRFRSFLTDVEKSLRLIDVESVTFTAPEDEAVYTYIITLRTYWLR